MNVGKRETTVVLHGFTSFWTFYVQTTVVGKRFLNRRKLPDEHTSYSRTLVERELRRKGIFECKKQAKVFFFGHTQKGLAFIAIQVKEQAKLYHILRTLFRVLKLFSNSTSP